MLSARAENRGRPAFLLFRSQVTRRPKRQNFRVTCLKESAAAPLEKFPNCFALAQEDKTELTPAQMQYPGEHWELIIDGLILGTAFFPGSLTTVKALWC